MARNRGWLSEYQGTPNFRVPGDSSDKVRDISNSLGLDSYVESCDQTLAAFQVAAFADFFFDFDNGAAVTLADCLTAAQRLICA